MSSRLQCKFNSPLGPLYLVASERGLQGIFWKKQNCPLLNDADDSGPTTKILGQSHTQLEKYFGGKLKDFSLPLDLIGTDFQKKVWTELQKIPYGQTCSYKDIAKKIRNPKAVRAVGSANGKNPLCIVVPCHRVIRSDGALGGYSGGLTLKPKLLALEGIETL